MRDSLPDHSTRDGEQATHMLTVRVPLRLIDNHLLDQALVSDSINGVLHLLRVAPRLGNAEVEMKALASDETEATS